MTNITRNKYGYEIETATCRMTIPHEDMSLLVNQYMKDTLRERIEDAVNDMDGDTIDMSKYEYTREEFIDEIFVDLEEEIDDGNAVSDDDITDKITNVADFYEMCI